MAHSNHDGGARRALTLYALPLLVTSAGSRYTHCRRSSRRLVGSASVGAGGGQVSFWAGDRVMAPDIEAATELVRSGAVLSLVAPYLAEAAAAESVAFAASAGPVCSTADPLPGVLTALNHACIDRSSQPS